MAAQQFQQSKALLVDIRRFRVPIFRPLFSPVNLLVADCSR
jgi:hypothetical protein